MAVCEKNGDSYCLFLSQNELDALGIVYFNVGGDPKKSRRKYVESVLEVIEEHASVKLLQHKSVDRRTGSIYFKDGE